MRAKPAHPSRLGTQPRSFSNGREPAASSRQSVRSATRRRKSGVIGNLREVKIEPMHLNGAVLFVKDFQRMRDFYAGMLETRPLSEEWTDSHAVFDLNGGTFVLHAIPDDYARGIKIASPPEARERNPVKVIFAVEDVPSECSRLAARGVTMLQRPWQNPTESCDGVDPEGNVFQIARSAR